MHSARLSCSPGMQCDLEGALQGDRWEEGRDPELSNLKRGTPRDEAPASEQQPAQPTSSGRGPLGSGSLAPPRDLPPHLLGQHPSGKVPLRMLPSGNISHMAEQLLCTDSASVPTVCGNAVRKA